MFTRGIGESKLTGLSVLSCIRKNSGSSFMMNGNAVETRVSLMLPQIHVKTGRHDRSVSFQSDQASRKRERERETTQLVIEARS